MLSRTLLLFSLYTLFCQLPRATASSSSCSVYMAKSSIPDAGWGVFAGQDFAIGDRIGTPSVAIPVIDLPFDNVEEAAKIYGGLTEYLWESASVGGFGEADRVDLFVPGPASLVNHHPALQNVLPGGLTHNAQFHRWASPMAGASTAYTEFNLIAQRDIKAGEELFVDRTRNAEFAHPLYYSKIPSQDDYDRMDEIVSGLIESLGSWYLTDAQWNDMLYRFSEDLIPGGFHGHERVDILRELFPKSKRELERCYILGSAKCRLMERSLDWLQSYGECLGSITTQPSTIPDAGHGAFATHKIPEGDVVSVSPLVAISHAAKAMTIPFKAEIQMENNCTYQLLTNYCFGHRHSDLMLCPTTQAALMNHGGAGSRQKPNVAIQWQVDYSIAEEDQLILKGLNEIATIKPEDVLSYKATLVMEYVALRDIEPGEELFIDYSEHWDIALQEHMNHGHSATSAEFVSATTFNEKNQPITVSSHIQSEGLFFVCELHPDVQPFQGDEKPDWEDFCSDEFNRQSTWPWEATQWYRENEAVSMYPCIVEHVDHAEAVAQVEVYDKPIVLWKVLRRFRNVPVERIHYMDALYRSDMHLPWAFRQFISIPDEMFPLRWRRDYKTRHDFPVGRSSTGDIREEDQDIYERALRNVKCGTYLAKSNIPNAGLGVFTAVDVPRGVVLGSYLSAIMAFEGKQSNKTSRWMGKDYAWEGSGFHAAATEGWPDLQAYAISSLFGALSNAHSGIHNLHHETGEWEPTLDAVTEYGAGAFTDYIGSAFRAMYQIGAGEELFLSYGDHWFQSRSEFSEVPLAENFNVANALLADLWSFLATTMSTEKVEEFASDLLSYTKYHLVDQYNTRTMGLLGEINTFEELQDIIQRGGVAEASITQQSTDWLEENGICVDNLYLSTSTLTNAGQGAFSRRFISKDSIIITSPTMVSTREFLCPHANRLDSASRDHCQMLLNYHWGHPASSILFYPLVPAAYINHGSGRMRNGKAPNVRLRFSLTDERSMAFEQGSLEDLLKEKYSTIMFDFVAIRDIKPDDEILIDYGKPWESAWKDYVASWKSPCGAKSSPQKRCFRSSKRVKAMNEDKFNPEFHEWSDAHISTCHFDEKMLEERAEAIKIAKQIPEGFDTSSDPTVMLSYEGIGYNHEGFDLPMYELKYGMHIGRPCRILNFTETSDAFDVIYFIGKTETSQGAKLLARLDRMPSSFIRYQVRPYQSDMMRGNAFRHEMMIPDELFPSHWNDEA